MMYAKLPNLVIGFHGCNLDTIIWFSVHMTPDPVTLDDTLYLVHSRPL